jgi:hypothetical protein
MVALFRAIHTCPGTNTDTVILDITKTLDPLTRGVVASFEETALNATGSQMPCLEPSALRLITLPLELLLDIAAYLSVYWSPSASRDIRSLSRVNHQLRQLCLPLLFSYLKCRTPERLLRLEQKLASDRGFAKLIRFILHVNIFVFDAHIIS